MSALATLRYLFVALLIAAIAFSVGLFLPLWTLMLIARDPGNIGGGLLTMWIGGPVGSFWT
jgi:hypothetical protein